MPEDDAPEQELGEIEQETDWSTLTVEEWRKREAKLKEEAHKLRTTLRRTEMSKEYGDEVLEFVPTSLPLAEQKELAAKLADRLAQKAQDAQQPSEPPAVAFEEPHLIEVPSTETERNLAAVAQGSSPSAASSAQTPLSTDEAAELAMRDPAAYERLKKAGLLKLEKLPGNL